MAYWMRSRLGGVDAPPITEAFTWTSERPGEREFIMLSQAVPGHDPAPDLQREISALGAEPGIGSYTEIPGIPELREAMAADIARDYACNLASDSIAITAGSNQGFCLAVSAIAQPGDNVVLPLPYFFNHQMWLEIQGIETRLVETRPEAGMLPDVADIAASIDGRTRAITLVTPNNPTGAIYPQDLLLEIFRLARRAGVALILDETYKDFRGTVQPPHALFCQDCWDDTFIHLYSLSKAYAMPGYRIGAVAAAPRLIREIEKLMDCITICAPHISQRAALYGLTRLADWKAEKVAGMAATERALRKAFERSDLRYRLVSGGAFFAYAEHPFDGEPAKAVAQRLARRHDLLVLPGSMFGPGQERFLRIAFANAEARTMPEVVERLVESQDPS